MSTETTSGYGIAVKKTGELAASASAAQAKALVEAKFVMAAHRPRNIMQARNQILEACKRPKFAERAWYAKPVGKVKDERGNWVQNFVRGPSIRFAEEAIRAMTNVATMVTILHEDDEKRILYIDVVDLESNTSYGDTVTIGKTIERKDSKGRDVVGERINSYGDKVFIVVATEDELTIKMGAAKSKIIRNSGLRLVPQDLIEEAEEVVEKTLNGDTTDISAQRKKMVDAFGEIGVGPLDLETFVGGKVETCSALQLKTLRGIYAAIKDGEAKWSDYVDGKETTDGNNTGEQTKGRRNRKPPGELQDPAQHKQEQPAATVPGELIPREGASAKDIIDQRLTDMNITDEIFVGWVSDVLDTSEIGKTFGNLKPETYEAAIESWGRFLKDIGRE